MNQWSKFVIGAVVTGFLASNVALANEAAAPADGAEKKTEKKGCKGKGKKAGAKGSCGGKGGCGAKDEHKDEHKEAPATEEKH